MTEMYVPSTWRRLTARGLDQLFCLPLYIPFGGIVWTLFTSEDSVQVSLFTFAVYLLIPVVYEIFFLILLQATPGKWLLDIKVVPAYDSGAKLALTQCFLRPIAGLFSLFVGWAIYATAFFRYDRTHAVDWFAETRVVQAVPRVRRPTLRWFVGSFLILMISLDSLRTAQAVLKNIDWQNKTVDLRLLTESSWNSENFEFEIEEDI